MKERQEKRPFSNGLFSIQSEGLACNRRQAYVITRSVYGITAGVFSFGLITYIHCDDYIPPAVDYIPQQVADYIQGFDLIYLRFYAIIHPRR